MEEGKISWIIPRIVFNKRDKGNFYLLRWGSTDLEIW
jgi:hypothetical protein